jgi:two-component system sensor histidine kinase CiaH
MLRADTQSETSAASAPPPRRPSLFPRPLRAGKRLAPPFAAARRRLVAINLVVVTAILGIMAVAVYVADAHALDQQINQELIGRVSNDSASDILAQLSHQAATTGSSSAGTVERDGADLGEQYEPSSPNVFALGLNLQGHVIYDPGHVIAKVGLPDLAAARPVLAGTRASTLVTTPEGAHEYRLYTTPLVEQGKIVGAVQVGMSLDTRDHQLRDLLATLALVGLAVMAITALASVYLAEQALDPARRAFERQHQFTAAASHELRTPLAFVRSQGDLVLGELSQSETAANRALAQDVSDMVDEVDYMARLVRDLLLLARDAHDSHALVWQRVDLAALATEVADRTRSLATTSGVEVTVHAPGEDHEAVIVRGDGDRLRQLLLILVGNAIQYTPAGGHVSISARAKAGRTPLLSHLGHSLRAEIEVRDDGIGIAPEHLEDIFTPFYQANLARSVTPAAEADDAPPEHRGAGLGLALAQWIVEAHGGSITVESALGEGSVFRITLPLADEQASAE